MDKKIAPKLNRGKHSHKDEIEVFFDRLLTCYRHEKVKYWPIEKLTLKTATFLLLKWPVKKIIFYECIRTFKRIDKVLLVANASLPIFIPV